jgi:hypothetical protein
MSTKKFQGNVQNDRHPATAAPATLLGLPTAAAAAAYFFADRKITEPCMFIVLLCLTRDATVLRRMRAVLFNSGVKRRRFNPAAFGSKISFDNQSIWNLRRCIQPSRLARPFGRYQGL